MDASRTRALELAKGKAAGASAIARVATETSAEAAAWAFTQWELRARGRAKFALADRILFTREALEQATHERVAAYHAAQFPIGEPVVDMTAGVGADLIALARRGPATGYELDAERAECARHNLAVHGLEAEIFEADSVAAIKKVRYAFADPSRRKEGRRLAEPEDYQPDPQQLAGLMRQMELGGIKLSPLLPDNYLESLGGRLEFVSFGGECREALVWLGRQVDEGRFAVQVETGDSLAARDGGGRSEEPSNFLFEADPAAIRAHALGTLCEAHGLRTLGDSNGYLTGDGLISSPWVQGHEILEVLKGDLKIVKAALRRLGASVAVIKSRAKGVDVRALQKQLGSEGPRDLLLIVYPVGKSLRYLLARPPGKFT